MAIFTQKTWSLWYKNSYMRRFQIIVYLELRILYIGTELPDSYRVSNKPKYAVLRLIKPLANQRGRIITIDN